MLNNSHGTTTIVLFFLIIGQYSRMINNGKWNSAFPHLHCTLKRFTKTQSHTHSRAPIEAIQVPCLGQGHLNMQTVEEGN